MKRLILVPLFVFFFICNGFAQEQYIGKWKTKISKDKKRDSIISIYKTNDGKFQGKIIKLPNQPGAICDSCEGEEKGKPIEGMSILKALELSSGELINGTIMDPETAKTYHCKISYEKQKERLKVRISLDKKGVLGQTEYWEKEQ